MSTTVKKLRPRNFFCSECGKPLWSECAACGVTGEQESQSPRFHCGAIQTGNYCSECGTRLPPKTVRCPSCNGRGWVKDFHVCPVSTGTSPIDPIPGFSIPIDTGPKVSIPRTPIFTDPIQRVSPAGESPSTIEQSGGSGLASWVFFILIIIAVVFIPEFRLFVRDLILWLWSLLQSLIRSLLA